MHIKYIIFFFRKKNKNAVLPTSNPQIVSTSNSSSNNSSAKSTSQIASKEPVFHTGIIRTANTRLGTAAQKFLDNLFWECKW